MFSAFVLLSWWLLLRALRLRTTWSWVWYGVIAAAMQLTHPFAPLVLVIEAGVVAVFAWRARRTDALRPLLRGYAIAVLLGFILVLPWYAYGALGLGLRHPQRQAVRVQRQGQRLHGPDQPRAVHPDGDLAARQRVAASPVLVALLLLLILAAAVRRPGS